MTYVMNINNWLTTHLPLLVYVVIERPLTRMLPVFAEHVQSIGNLYQLCLVRRTEEFSVLCAKPRGQSSMLKLFKSAKNFVTIGLEHQQGYRTRKQYKNRLLLYNPFPVRKFWSSQQWITLYLELRVNRGAQSQDGNNLLKTAGPTNLKENLKARRSN